MSAFLVSLKKSVKILSVDESVFRLFQEEFIMLKGIAASAGVSVAKVYKLETPKVVIEKKQEQLKKK